MWVLIFWIAAWVISALVIWKFTKNAIYIIGGSFLISCLSLVAVIETIPATPQQQNQQKADAQKQAQEAKAAAARKAKECRQDLKCWSDKLTFDATVACKPKIEGRAKYDYKWTDGLLHPTFVKIGWADKKAGVVNFFGDQIQFQNGFGNWMRMTYMCTYDPAKKAVTDVQMQPGRLPSN